MRVPLLSAPMEQPPEREETIPAPSSGEETPQLLEEAAGGEEIPAGGRESPARDEQEEGDVSSNLSVEQPHLPSDEHPREDAQEKQPMEGEGSLPGAPMPSLGAGVVGLPAEPPQARSPSREAEADFYCVKWITWKGERTPVIMQSENGPCPLLAIMNILFLQWKASGVPGREFGGLVRGHLAWLPPDGEGLGLGAALQPLGASR